MLSFVLDVSSISAAAESAFCSETFPRRAFFSSSFDDNSARKAEEADEDAGKRF